MTPADRAEIIRLLPCYRMGQLEPAEADAVRQALHDDPTLRELLATIQDAERLCAATLRQGAPAGLRSLTTAPEPPTRLAPIWAWFSSAVVAAVLVVMVLSGQGPARDSAQLEPLEDMLIAARIGDQALIEATTPQGLAQALLAVDVPPELAHVADLRSLGLTLEGGLYDGERVGVVWRSSDGQALLCVMGPRVGIHRTPDQIHRPDTGTGPVLQGHQLLGFSALYWEQDGLGCALVSGGSLDQLAAIAFRAVWSPAS